MADIGSAFFPDYAHAAGNLSKKWHKHWPCLKCAAAHSLSDFSDKRSRGSITQVKYQTVNLE